MTLKTVILDVTSTSLASHNRSNTKKWRRGGDQRQVAMIKSTSDDRVTANV